MKNELDQLKQLRKVLEGMIESYDILINDSPLSRNPIALGVIKGAFIGTIDDARKCLSKNIKCEKCNGSGCISFEGYAQDCEACNATGYIKI
jgi:hypothetical protein